MSNEYNKHTQDFLHHPIRQKDKITVISFFALGIIEILYIITSFIIGRSFGYFRENDQLFYPYNRNAQAKGSVCILVLGLLNAFYIFFNQKISFHNKRLNFGIKAGIPVLSWGLSEFLYRLGYNSAPWNAISMLYGVYNPRKIE